MTGKRRCWRHRTEAEKQRGVGLVGFSSPWKTATQRFQSSRLFNMFMDVGQYPMYGGRWPVITNDSSQQ